MKHLLVLGVCAALCVAAAHAQMAAQDQPQNGDLVPPTSASDFTASQLDTILAGSWRSPANRARDVYRHPKATLQFFGIQPDQTVIEITPGSGWYSEILAPLLMDNGHYIAALEAPASGNAAKSGAATLRAKFAADAAHYGKATFVEFNPSAPMFGPPASADMVLTFRNAHNWAEANTAPAMFKAFFAVLKPGGVLGLVDHRAVAGSKLDEDIKSGYLPVSYITKLATDAGFKLQASSEINANPKDDTHHPSGVWTLPPTYALKDKDHDKYAAIGESDRMTLRFVKPGAPASASSAPPSP